MEERHYAFFQNTDCEYFPCHKTAHPERFNCPRRDYLRGDPL